MTDHVQTERFRPPEASLEMPYQVIERSPPKMRWLVLLRQLTARGAPNK